MFLIANIVTTSKALVTSSDALVPSSFLPQCVMFIYVLCVQHHTVSCLESPSCARAEQSSSSRVVYSDDHCGVDILKFNGFKELL